MTSKKRTRQGRGTSRLARKNPELLAHLTSLGWRHQQEYDSWCLQHGFDRSPYKSWRDQRAELDFARALADRAAVQQHIETLGLHTVDAYNSWCLEHDLEPSLEKSVRQRRKEWELRHRQTQKEQPQGSPRPNQTVDRTHLQALGLETIEDYERWCAERGFGTALNKSARKLRRARELARLESIKRQARNTREVIERIARGDLDAADLRADLLIGIQAGFAELDGDLAGQEALRELLLHLEQHSELLSSWTAITRLGVHPANTYIAGVVALVRHRNRWVRPIEDWRPDSRNVRRQFSSLARYLLAPYEVPAFMDTAWFLDGTEESRRQQDWFVHIGQGQNIRTIDPLPVQLTKRMAHAFLQAPSHLTVVEALRWAQIVGQGGDEELVQAIIATRLGRSFAEEPFWGTVIHFLSRHRMLDPDCVGRIVSYLQCQKYDTQHVATPDGQVRQVPPPEPNLSMKSRSVLKLLRSVDRWYVQRSKEATLPAGEWRTSGNGNFSFVEEDPRTGRSLEWTISEIVSNRALLEEGRAMKHCVVSYARRCAKGDISIWSLQVNRAGSPRHVMTIAVDNRKSVITQARGRFNAHHDHELASDALAPDEAGTRPKGA